MLEDVPSNHWHFLENQLVYPDLPMSDQPDYMLRWKRCDEIAPHESGKIIVCGHTPQRTGRPLNRGFAICLDTNACRGGRLTCLDAASGRVWQAEADRRVHRSHISDFSDE